MSTPDQGEPTFPETKPLPPLVTYDENDKPLYETGWGFRILHILDKEVQAHETGNLWINIFEAKRLREESKLNPRVPMLPRTYDFFYGRGLRKVFDSFEDDLP